MPYYIQEMEKRPQYTFESWFGYLKNQILIRQDGYNVNITVRGKEFLKYLVQYGRTASDKQYLDWTPKQIRSNNFQLMTLHDTLAH